MNKLATFLLALSLAGCYRQEPTETIELDASQWQCTAVKTEMTYCGKACFTETKTCVAYKAKP